MLLRTTIAWCLMVAVAGAQTMRGQGGAWNRVRYSGGTVQAKADPFDWNTTVKVLPDDIVFTIAYRKTVHIKPSEVTALSYGREAHRRVADMVTLSLMLSPLALFGLLHESKIHFIGIEYRAGDGKPGAVLLEAHKDDYRSILGALKTVTGKAVANEP